MLNFESYDLRTWTKDGLFKSFAVKQPVKASTPRRSAWKTSLLTSLTVFSVASVTLNVSAAASMLIVPGGGNDHRYATEVRAKPEVPFGFWPKQLERIRGGITIAEASDVKTPTPYF